MSSDKARQHVIEARNLDTKIAREALIAVGDDLTEHGQPELAKHYYEVAANTNKHVLASLRRMMK